MFSLVDIGQVHLYQGCIQGTQRVEQRNRRVAEGAGIQDRPGKTAGDFLYPGDQLAFAVALPAFDRTLEPGRLGAAHRLDIGKRRPAIDVRLPRPSRFRLGPLRMRM